MANTKVSRKLILIPSPGKGHLVSTLQFAKQLLDHTSSHTQLSITILIIPGYGFADTEYDDTNNTQIQHIHLPKVETEVPKSGPEKFISAYVCSYKPLVKDAIKNIMSSETTQLVGLVVDMFCTSMIEVANELNVPSYLFLTSGAGFLGLLYHLLDRYDRVGTHVLESDKELRISAYANAVPVSSLPFFALYEDGHEAFVAHARKFKETKGIFINTFVELESHAVKSLRSMNSEHDQSYPPIYTVGPIVDFTSITTSTVDHRADKIMKWLDDQPPSSVVLLCFGSMGSFKNPLQLHEIALGLERSGHRFLWSVREPPHEGRFERPNDYNSYEEILPPGYLGRIGDRGMVCGWIPQVKVLAHPAVGGFVSHCGWNSILESLWFGVPIVTWPLSAEQQLNAFQLVKDLGIAIELTLDYRRDGDKLVYADDIERAVTRVMDEDSEVRKRAKEMGETSRRAMSEGGSSFVSYGHLLNHVFKTM